MEIIITACSALLGGVVVLLSQWYIFRNDRFSTRRRLLYNLLEIYSNLHLIKHLPLLDELYSDLLSEQEHLTQEMIALKHNLLENLKEQTYDNVLNSIDEINEKYLDIVSNLSKEDPILAFYISNHGKSINKMLTTLNSLTTTIKNSSNIDDYSNIDEVFTFIFENNLIDSEIESVRDSALKVSRGISYLTCHRIKKELLKIEDKELQKLNLRESVNSIFEKIDELK